MINPEEDNYANDPEDALRKTDDVENIKEISGDSSSIEHDKEQLEQADRASKPSYELDLDNLEEEQGD